MKSAKMIWTLALLLCIGCGGGHSTDPEPGDPVVEIEGATTPANEPVPPPPPPAPPAASTTQDNTDEDDGPPSLPPEAVIATPGVTGKGQDYGPGPVSTPIAAYFSVRERLVFDVQVVSAMKMFKATNGRFPKSQAEFDTQILQQNMITLPKLRSGEAYFYDAKKAATMRNYDPQDPPLFVVDAE